MEQALHNGDIRLSYKERWPVGGRSRVICFGFRTQQIVTNGDGVGVGEGGGGGLGGCKLIIISKLAICW